MCANVSTHLFRAVRVATRLRFTATTNTQLTGSHDIPDPILKKKTQSSF